MIAVKRIEKDHDKYCNACTAQRKLHYNQLSFYRIEYGPGHNTTILHLCDECASQLAVKIMEFESEEE